MLKKIGLPILALAAVMAFAAPQKADARVRFGISVGAPVYVAPAPAPAPYYDPYYAGDPNYYAPPAVDPYAYGYVAPAPVYTTPYYSAPVFSFGFGGHRGWEHERHERNERFEHGRGFGWRR